MRAIALHVTSCAPARQLIAKSTFRLGFHVIASHQMQPIAVALPILVEKTFAFGLLLGNWCLTELVMGLSVVMRQWSDVAMQTVDMIYWMNRICTNVEWAIGIHSGFEIHNQFHYMSNFNSNPLNHVICVSSVWHHLCAKMKPQYFHVSPTAIRFSVGIRSHLASSEKQP